MTDKNPAKVREAPAPSTCPDEIKRAAEIMLTPYKLSTEALQTVYACCDLAYSHGVDVGLKKGLGEGRSATKLQLDGLGRKIA